MRRMPVVRVRRVRRAVSRRSHMEATMFRRTVKLAIWPGVCPRICPRTAATEGMWCMWCMWCPVRPRSLMSRKKSEAEQGPVACDLLKCDDGNTLVYEKAQSLVPILATRLSARGSEPRSMWPFMARSSCGVTTIVLNCSINVMS